MQLEGRAAMKTHFHWSIQTHFSTYLALGLIEKHAHKTGVASTSPWYNGAQPTGPPAEPQARVISLQIVLSV